MKPRHLVASILIVAAVTGAQAQEVGSLHRRLFSTPPPSRPIDPALVRLLDESGERRVHAVLVFAEPLAREQHVQLREAGVEVLGSLGRNAYSVSLPGPATVLDRLPDLARATRIRPREKLSPALAARRYPRWAFDPETRRIKVLVEFHRDVSPRLLERALRELGIRATRHGPRTLALEVKPDDLERITQLDMVKRVQQGPIPFLPLNDSARSRVHSEEAQDANFDSARPTYRASGEGVKLGICDGGIDEGHDDFDEVGDDGKAGASRVDPPRDEMNRHGTHVASIAAGSGVNSADSGKSAFALRGHAPSAQVADYDASGAHLKKSHKVLAKDGMALTNHSYVQSLEGYDVTAAELDEIVRGDAKFKGKEIPAKPQVWAAGNSGQFAKYLGHGATQSGYHSVFTSAKNTISVGSIDSLNGRLTDLSSLGPTLDGRIKPDLVAPGCRDSWAGSRIQAAKAGSQRYVGICGTSMAAPVVTGIIALMMHQYQISYGGAPKLLPSTYKAMLVHTAEDQIKLAAHESKEFNSPDTAAPVLYHAGPDFATGWGVVHAENAREIVTHEDRWEEDEIGQQGEKDEWCLEVPAGSPPVRATISWDDVPGDTNLAWEFLPDGTLRPTDTPMLVHDLDLELVRPAPDDSVVLPWTIAPLALDLSSQSEIQPAYRGADHLNNIEMATWGERRGEGTPVEGAWRVRVRGTKLDDGRAQSYSLVTSHPILPCP